MVQMGFLGLPKSLTLSYLKMTGDIDIGNNKLKTTNYLIKEIAGAGIGVRLGSDLDYCNIYLASLVPSNYIGFSTVQGKILTSSTATSSILIQTHNGSSRVTNFKLMGGFVKAYNLISMGGYGKFQWDGDNIIFGPKVKLDDPDCNLALSGTASDFGAGLNPNNAIDGDPASYAGPYTMQGTEYADMWQLDLGAIFDKVIIAIKWNFDNSSSALKILGSTDGENWTTITEIFKNQGLHREITQTETNLRYIKLQHKTGDSLWTLNTTLYEVVVLKGG